MTRIQARVELNCDRLAGLIFILGCVQHDADLSIKSKALHAIGEGWNDDYA